MGIELAESDLERHRARSGQRPWGGIVERTAVTPAEVASEP